ncbi:MAG: glycoside hydrolase family 5 protein [Oscillospiraceae bacterium]|nr:glycoside hydrolase family 5 protein [Oscillospiraceae bacterium]
MLKSKLHSFFALITMISMISGVFAFTGCTRDKSDSNEEDEGRTRTSADVSDSSGEQSEVSGNVTPMPMQLMTREGENDWSAFFESDTFDIVGNGTYDVKLNIPGTRSVLPMIAVSTVGTTVDDRKNDKAIAAPEEYLGALVSIESVKINGSTALTLTNNTDVPLVQDGGPLEGYANFQIWNAWDEPQQRVVPDSNVKIQSGSNRSLEFTSPVSSIEVTFTVSGVGAGTSGTATTGEEATSKSPGTAPPPVSVDITGDFDTSLTSEQLVGNIGVGWNLGNTLDAYYSEDPGEPFHWVDYNNMAELETAWLGGVANVTTPALIKRVKDSGFNAIRIPVTWYKMTDIDNGYVISPQWMEHVKSIVNMAVAEDMYIILNTHHDEFVMRFDNADEGERAITALWTQIASTFNDYNEKLIFEGLNEPRRRNNAWNTQGQWNWSGSSGDYEILNRWNQAFVNAVRATGGNNQYRHLMLPTYAAQGHDGPLKGFVLPSDPVSGNGKGKFILSVHIYSPHDWAHNGNGSYRGVSSIETDLNRVADRAAELGVPVILGEFGTVARNSHEDRVQHAGDYIRTATEMRKRSSNPVVMACFWWDDNGSFLLAGRTRSFSDNSIEIIKAMINARG